MYQDVNQAKPPPPFAPTMASAAASHVAQQPSLQYLAQQLDPATVAAAAAAAGVSHNVAPTAAAMAMAASAIVAGGQQTLVKRVVKAVISGDYLVLRDQPRGGPPPEYYVNLAHVQAPRFNRTPGDGEGKSSLLEPWAWEAKEYLTKRLIGQEVFFRSDYTRPAGQMGGATSGIASGNRDFGTIFLGEENIVETMVREGLLEVRVTKTESPILQQLIEAEEAAKAAGVGRWSGEPPKKRELIHEHPQPNQLKGKMFNGTVEVVRNGGALQVYLELEEGHKYLSANVMVSGIRCPDKNKATETKFSEEAKYFTESRLLNREVKVHIEKITTERSQTAFLASVFLGQNNLAEALLRQGMARCFDASITLTKAPEKLRAAEKEAKSKRLRIWENYIDKGDGPSESFEAKVLEVVSGDQLMVQNLLTNEIKKIFLASIRLGAPVDRDRQREPKQATTIDFGPEPTKAPAKQPAGKSSQPVQAEPPRSSVPRIFENPILFNARELLRKKLLGKKVLVKVEYVQPKSDSYPEKLCCTVVPADQPKWNCAEALVSRGYASVNKFMSDDTQRASNFDELLKAEQNALKTKDNKDKDKQKELAPLKIVDLCNDLARAKQLYPFLSRTRKDAVVEFVYSASRFKMFLAKENNSLLNLILAGVNVPRDPDALKNEATSAAKLLVHQRDVSIQIDSMDKKGNFIGWIFYKGEDNKETSINLQLVKLGFAQVRDSSAASTLNELKSAEVVAREKKLGLWLNYQEPKVGQEEPAAPTEAIDENEAPEDESSAANATANALAAKEAELMKNRKPVIVTFAHIEETVVRVFVQSFEDGAKLEELMKQMRTDLPATGGKKSGSGEGYTPTRNEIVAARFSEDKQWYRAKVEKVISPQEIEILYIDYGNREKVKSRDLAKLSPKFASPDPCAKEYALAFIEVSTHDEDWVKEARRAFVESTLGKVLLRVEYKDPISNLEAISLVDDQSKTDVGKKLVEEGLLITQRRRERKLMRTINEYLQAEKTARRNRTNMWQYGDFTKDDAKEFGHRSVAA